MKSEYFEYIDYHSGDPNNLFRLEIVGSAVRVGNAVADFHVTSMCVNLLAKLSFFVLSSASFFCSTLFLV